MTLLVQGKRGQLCLRFQETEFDVLASINRTGNVLYPISEAKIVIIFTSHRSIDNVCLEPELVATAIKGGGGGVPGDFYPSYESC